MLSLLQTLKGWSWDAGTVQLMNIHVCPWGVLLVFRLLSSRMQLSLGILVFSRCHKEKTPLH